MKVLVFQIFLALIMAVLGAGHWRDYQDGKSIQVRGRRSSVSDAPSGWTVSGTDVRDQAAAEGLAALVLAALAVRQARRL